MVENEILRRFDGLPKSSFFKYYWGNIAGTECDAIYSDSPDIIFLRACEMYNPRNAGGMVPFISKYDWKNNKFIWKQYYNAITFTFHPDINRVALFDYDNKVIRELDASTGALIRTISSSNLGSFGLINLRYDFWHPNYVWIADRLRHYVGRLNLDTGTIDFQFGVPDTPGSDLTHLNNPRYIFPDWTYDPPRRAVVTDWKNHRILVLDLTTSPPSVMNPMYIVPYPNVFTIMQNKTGPFNYAYGIGVEGGGGEGGYQPLTLIFSDFGSIDGENLLAHIPMATDVLEFNPFNPFIVLLGQWNSVFEVDWRRPPTHLRRFSKWFARNLSLTAGSSWQSVPIVGMVHDKFLIKVYSSQPATMFIEVPEPKFKGIQADINFTWKVFGGTALQADKVTPWSTLTPPDVFRIRVVMGSSSGNISVYGEGW
jgi:hypothetical protein